MSGEIYGIPYNRDPNGILKGLDCFALDMDGTVYLGERWIGGALDFLAELDGSGKKYIFMTNNSSKSAAEYLGKLKRMGLEINGERLATSGEAAIRLLKRDYAGKRAYLMGNSSLTREFINAGIILDEHEPELVVTAFDTSLDYPKLCRVCDFVRKGLPFIATHPDFNCPTETGYIPDAGSFHALIEASTGRRPDVIAGKPYREIIEVMLEKAGAKAAKTAVIGDRLYTDVACGVNNGLKGILVLSGEAVPEDLKDSKVRPDLVFDSVREMIPFL